MSEEGSGVVGFFAIIAFFIITPILAIVLVAACRGKFGRASWYIAGLLTLPVAFLVFICVKLAIAIHQMHH